jgi:cytochrome b6-f complex iron-sulfur subunit
MKRREFLNWVGVGGLAASLPVVIAACSAPSEPAATEGPQSGVGKAIEAAEGAATTLETGGGFVAAGTIADLDSQGFLTLDTPAKAIVIRDPANPAGVLALSRVCNHEKCTVDWVGDRNIFLCPCHDAELSPDGSRLKGPTTAGLTPYTAKIEGDQVLVQIS